LFSELKINARIAVEGENLGRLARKCMDEAGIAHPRIAIWGARGRGEYALRTNPWLKEHTRILVDAASWLHGQQLTSCGALVQAPEALCGEPIDLLLVATRMDFYDQVFVSASALLAPGTRLVNLLETRTVQ
jgi:hypothetical protein